MRKSLFLGRDRRSTTEHKPKLWIPSLSPINLMKMNRMNRHLLLLFVLRLVTPVLAQVPRPYAFGGLSLNGGGYGATAETLGGGLDFDTNKIIAIAEISADNAHKRDSDTGRDLFIKARAFYNARNGWYFGGGVQQNRLETVAYSKQAWRPTFGGGKDLIRETFSLRAQALYVLPGTDHLNATQGPEISVWLPSPASKAHWLYREAIGIYEYHQTAVTDNAGTESRYVTAFTDFAIQYRF
jgi:hypothetical protein